MRGEVGRYNTNSHLQMGRMYGFVAAGFPGDYQEIMTEISDNMYNRTVRPDAAKLKVWRYAGLMLTYRCPASCAFCYYNCGPEAGGLMSVDMAMRTWESLEQLGGAGARVHLTGGEPFLYFDRLAAIVEAAQRSGLRGPDTIETNGFWATNREIIREQLGFLSDRGMERLKISWDAFHAEYIDEGCVRRLVETARELLGPARVLVRWEKYLQEPVRLSPPASPETYYRAAVSDFPCRFTGRAAGALAALLADKRPDAFEGVACLNSFLSAKGIHVDPFGNVFSGLCSGIIVGNAAHKPLEAIWRDFDPLQVDVVRTLSTEGPYGLMRAAEARGYAPAAYFAGKCHLCTSVREFFFDNGRYEMIIGPGECFGRRASDKRRLTCE
ncbi:MAG: radical SAM protein [Phycisphaerae bacterium]|nr:radical SAM protein [Phycisphaerae bacterium]